jgi:hypothetical protein
MPEEQNKSINLGVDDGKEFFAHETSVNFNPTQFIFDFRCITPRIDPRSREIPFIALKHNVIMVDPWHAKEILRILNNSVQKFEEQFGTIEQPKAVQKYLKDAKKMQKKEPSLETQTPSYFG